MVKLLSYIENHANWTQLDDQISLCNKTLSDLITIAP